VAQKGQQRPRVSAYGLKASRISPIIDLLGKHRCGTEPAAPCSDRVMNKIVWTEQYRIGVKKIDEQHREFFSIVNELIVAEGSTAPSERLHDVVFRVSGYAAYHFRTEEQIMTEYGYPGHSSQVNEHTAFRIKTARFCADAIAGKSGLLAEMLEYLTAWLTTHILNSDAKFRDFLIDQGFSPET
jgi:hemerythrin